LREAITEAVKARADLSGADLSGADLSRADLSGADLSRADLSGAYGISLELSTPLALLAEQVGKVRLYKLVDAKGEGPFNGGLIYEIGKSYRVTNADCDPRQDCGAGINVASLDWCLKEWRPGWRVLVVEFTTKDIACIPLGSDGKIRLHRCRVVAEKDVSELVKPFMPKQ
jgi:hypothetical protein